MPLKYIKLIRLVWFILFQLVDGISDLLSGISLICNDHVRWGMAVIALTLVPSALLFILSLANDACKQGQTSNSERFSRSPGPTDMDDVQDTTAMQLPIIGKIL